MDKEPMKLVFTSFRDSKGMGGLKVSIDRRPPKPCSYPILFYMIMPIMGNLSQESMEKICNTILDNNWGLIRDFIDEIYELGIHQVIFCDWCTKEQIVHGKFCGAGIIGNYIRDKTDRDGEFEFPVEINYKDGREAL